MAEPVWRTAQEVAVIFGVKPGTVRIWQWRGHIHADDRGRYDLNEVLDWWDNRRSTTYAELRAQRRTGSPDSTAV